MPAGKFANSYHLTVIQIETIIQKGYNNGISGRFEHTSHLDHVINNAWKSQPSLIVTLLDLRNAF